MIDKTNLEMEIRDLKNVYLFMHYHDGRGGHTLEEHVNIPYEHLKRRAIVASNQRKHGERRKLLHEKDGRPAELSVFSTFYGNTQDVVNLISDALLQNIEEVQKYINGWDAGYDYDDAPLYLSFDEPIGEGILEEGNWHNTYKLHGLTIVLVPSERKDRSFLIKTAYPDFSWEYIVDDELNTEVDYGYEQLDEYFRRRFH